MHVVVIKTWKEVTDNLVQSIAAVLGNTAYEVRQRLIGNGPAIMASYADPRKAVEMAEALSGQSISTLVLDADDGRSNAGHIFVRRFELTDKALRIEIPDGRRAQIPWETIDLLLPCSGTIVSSEKKTVTERKFSTGKAIVTGGLLMSKKVTRQDETIAVTSKKVLYLYVNGRKQPAVFIHDQIEYDGLGLLMQLSREINFARLSEELRKLSTRAVCDDRLLQRIGQTRLLGPTLNPETNLDLAAAILARTLRPMYQ